MPIKRRGSVWHYSITIRNKTHRGSCKTSDEQQAREFHDRERARLWRVSLLGDKPRRTWAETVKRWMGEHADKRSRRDDERHQKFWNEQFSKQGVVYLDEIEPDVVTEIIEEAALKVTVRKTQIKPATLNRKLQYLRSVMNAAAREYMWLGVSPKFSLFPEFERLRYINRDEFVRLHAALPSPFNDMALLAVVTGLRRGNITGLRWDQLDFQRRTATFSGQVMKNGKAFSIPLNDTAIAVIRKQLGKHDELVFPTPTGLRYIDIPSEMWREALQATGIEDFRWHDLRHTWASWLRQDGETLDRIQELGGWEDESMVQRYAHLDVSHLSTSASRLDRLIGALHVSDTATQAVRAVNA